MSASNFVCKVCGSNSPPVFALSTQGKFPLCADDLGKFVASQGVLTHTIFPIAAISFIESASDLPLYEQRTAEMTQCMTKIEKYLSDAERDYAISLQVLEAMEADAVQTVESEFEKAKKKVQSMHDGTVAALINALGEFEQGKVEKLIEFGRVSKAVYERRENVERPLEFYSGAITDVRRTVREAARQVLALKCTDEQEFLVETLKKPLEKAAAGVEQTQHGQKTNSLEAESKGQEEAAKPASKEKPPAGKASNCPKAPSKPQPPPAKPTNPQPAPGKQPESPPLLPKQAPPAPKEAPRQAPPPAAKAETLNSSQFCYCCTGRLTANNYISLSDHAECSPCLDCIRNKNNIYLRCPQCHRGYCTESKDVLEGKIPDLVAKLTENKRKLAEKKKKGPILSCSQCGDQKDGIHLCTSGPVCLDCWERQIASHSYKRKLACPGCDVDPSVELAKRDRKKCFLCRKELGLGEVAHWCNGREVIVCGGCTALISVNGACMECEKKIAG